MSEREKFEAWYTQWRPLHGLARMSNEMQYVNNEVQAAWIAWQAALARPGEKITG